MHQGGFSACGSLLMWVCGRVWQCWFCFWYLLSYTHHTHKFSVCPWTPKATCFVFSYYLYAVNSGISMSQKVRYTLQLFGKKKLCSLQNKYTRSHFHLLEYNPYWFDTGLTPSFSQTEEIAVLNPRKNLANKHCVYREETEDMVCSSFPVLYQHCVLIVYLPDKSHFEWYQRISM